MKKVLTITSALAMTIASAANASQFRVQFQGSEAIAIASPARPAGYLGVAPAAPGNLSAPCPTCVPGGTASTNYGAGVPNQIVTFLHPYTGQAITLPLTLPAGKPRIVTKSDRIVYDYGLFGYRVVVKFLPNGRAEVVYND